MCNGQRTATGGFEKNALTPIHADFRTIFSAADDGERVALGRAWRQPDHAFAWQQFHSCPG